MTEPSDGRAFVEESVWRVTTIAAGWLLLLFVGAYLIAPASLLPVVMSDLGITEATAAALVSMPQVAATVIGVPVGIYLDRVEARVTVPVAAAILLVGSVGDWFAASAGAVSLLIGSRLLAGVGMFVLWVTCINVAASTVPPTRRATATSVIISGYPAGYALGHLGAPRVAAFVGWPGVFPVFGVAVLVMSVGLYVAVGRVSKFHASTEPMTLLGFKRVIQNRDIWSVLAVTILGYSLYMVFGVSLAESGTFVAVFPAVGIVARPVGGWLSDAVLGQRRRPVFAASFVGATVLAVAMFYSVTMAVLVGILVLAGVFVQLQIGLMYQSAQELVDPRAAGTAVSLASVAGWLGSFVLFVFAVGLGVTGGLTVWQMAESGTAAA